jgi:NitT/TauT family transport system ATP-binding protein
MPIVLNEVSLNYPANNRGPARVLRDIDLTIQDGEFLSVVGPSGCGKSTLLRLLAGLIAPTSGRLSVDIARRRSGGLAFVFQSPVLLPWRTAKQNIMLPLGVLGIPRAQAEGKVADVLSLVRLEEFKHFYPSQLSGGMQQRVALARALATDPSLLLMDEPFSALDFLTAEALSDDLLHLWESMDITVVHVTHDILEAVYLADRIAVLSPRPAKIAATFEVKLPRPRAESLRESKEFGMMCRDIRAAVQSQREVPNEPMV